MDVVVKFRVRVLQDVSVVGQKYRLVATAFPSGGGRAGHTEARANQSTAEVAQEEENMKFT
jgi:hypothetical protein